MEKIQIRPKILLGVSVLAAIACALMIFKVNINSDMTKYLPDDSKMKQGLDILSSEFGQGSSSSTADIRIMVKALDDKEKDELKESLGSKSGVDAVSISNSGDYTLYELKVSKSVHQKKLAREIKEELPYDCLTQTSQDGNTPDPKALILAVVCLFAILLVMSDSYVEPLLFLLSTGMAVAVNMGTNAFLDSVSITTHSIAAVLQLALSMDYSIILMNRYRQQLSATEDKYAAMNIAIKKATPAVLSSSLTTVVGLLMLAFMNLKIGKDLGIVLAKGVLCSLLYTYAVLPGLILLCDDAIRASHKKSPHPHTDGLANFSLKWRIPITAAFILIFAFSWQLSTRTPIKFSTSTPSGIDEVFPKKNTVVLIYDNAAESQTVKLLDSISTDPKVQNIYSYPTLMKKQLSAEDMVSMLQKQASAQGRSGAEMLTAELMRICYYAHLGDKNLKISFTDLVDYITSLSENPLLASVDIPDLSGKLELLSAIREMNAVQEETPTQQTVANPPMEGDEEKDEAKIESSSEPVLTQETVIAAEKGLSAELLQEMTMYEYMKRLDAEQNSADSHLLLSLSDPAKLRTRMSVEQMTAFIGSTPAQTRMIYSLSKNSKEGMTPVEFAHFLTDDLFNRKALSKMVNPEQKEGMLARTAIMDAAVSEKPLDKSTLDAMVLRFGLKEGFCTETSEQNKPFPAAQEPIESSTIIYANAAEAEIDEVDETVDEADKLQSVEESPEDSRMVLLNEMLKPGNKYEADAMARNFRSLGEKMDEGTVALLYDLYGSTHYYDNAWTMDLDFLIGFVKEKIINNESLSAYIGEDVRSEFDSMEAELTQGVGMLRGEEHSMAVIISDYSEESVETENFIKSLEGEHYLIGESVMLSEMKDSFKDELRLVTLLTILAIFSIVTITFRSVKIALTLVMTVMSAVFINVTACGIGGGSVLYLAYLIVQSILMGASIDYGILFTTYYRENYDLKEAYRGSIHTILTSGLIICCVPGVMALLLNDAMIQPIVKCLAIGSFSAIVMILFLLPGVLSLLYRKKK